MAYTKPQVIAQNASTGSYAAGCPADNRGWPSCLNCERTQ
ncbi:Bacteriocin [Treponema peruense]